MRRVLAGMGASVIAAADEEELDEALAYLRNKPAPPVLIVARVTLRSGSGIRLLERAAAVFPGAGRLLVSHHPRNLLMLVPGFVEHSRHFLPEEFTDEQFRRAVAQILTALRAA